MKDQTLNFLTEICAIVLISSSIVINDNNIYTMVMLFTIGTCCWALRYIGQGEEIKQKVKKK